jgi:hypothetical protein
MMSALEKVYVNSIVCSLNDDVRNSWYPANKIEKNNSRKLTPGLGESHE